MRTASALGDQRATDLLKDLLQRQAIPLAPKDFSDLYQRLR
jgi:hypothetical protein